MKFAPAALSLAFLFASQISWGADDYEKRIAEFVKAREQAEKQGPEAVMAVMEKQSRGLVRDFPDKPDGYIVLLQVAEFGGVEKAKDILKQIDFSKAPEEVQSMSKGMQARLDLIGKPLDLKYKAIDGREVDLAAMKGKVVLLDFWATWCGPCVASLPDLKAIYEKLHAKGFEVLGISLDEDKTQLEEFLKTKEVPWPQFFDGQGWQGAFPQKFKITLIPTVWLVNKKGVLVDIAAHDSLAKKVEALLAE